MDPALRTRRLADSLKDVGFASTFVIMFGRVPFASLVVLGYLAMGCADLGRLSSGTPRLALRGAAVLVAAAAVLPTVAVWVENRWLAIGWVLAVGFVLLLLAVGLSGLAVEFGGALKWQRARAAGVVAACATSFIAGMLQQANTPRWGVHIGVPGGAGSWVAFVALFGSLSFIGIAWSDLRGRVKAAIVQSHAEAAAALAPSEHVRG